MWERDKRRKKALRPRCGTLWILLTGVFSKRREQDDTTPNPRIRRTPAHVILFSRGSRLESSSQQESLCLAKESFPRLAQHVTHVLTVVSFTLEHYTSFHMHSSPSFYPTIYQTSVAVHFTRRCTLRGSVEFGPKDTVEPFCSIFPADDSVVLT